MAIELTTVQWLVAILAAFLVGLAKTGIPGVGVLVVALFALIMPARESAGAVLPLLICADIIAVAAYRRDAVWPHLLKLMPWAVAGIIAGYAAMAFINDQQTARLIGGILLVMICVHLLRTKSQNVEEMLPGNVRMWYAAMMGLIAGFTTMVANAAGPVMNLYLLAMRMPKMKFMGTAAWYFLILNSFKVPFSLHLGLISRESIILNLKLAPMVVAGALLGRLLLSSIPQKLFEAIALFFTTIAAVRLLLM